jgi:hypothetical protein
MANMNIHSTMNPNVTLSCEGAETEAFVRSEGEERPSSVVATDAATDALSTGVGKLGELGDATSDAAKGAAHSVLGVAAKIGHGHPSSEKNK